jgi:lipoprotein-releasing system permease protein
MNPISGAAISVGVATVIVTMGVMDGFEKELKDRVAGSDFHIRITSIDGTLYDHERIIYVAEKINGLLSVQPFIEGQAIFRSGDRSYGGIIETDSELREGEMVLGKELANILRVKTGEPVVVVTANRDGKPRMDEFIFKRAFRFGIWLKDASFAKLSISDAQRLFGIEGVSGVGIMVYDIHKANEVKEKLLAELGHSYWIRTWSDMNRSLFEALKIEKQAMAIILTMVLLLATVTVFASSVLSVIRRRREIGILRALGVSQRDVSAIFLIEGGITGGIGVLIGALLGLSIIWAVSFFDIVRLPGDIYYSITSVPIKINRMKIALISLCALALSLLSSVWPALWASSLDPQDALRYE